MMTELSNPSVNANDGTFLDVLEEGSSSDDSPTVYNRMVKRAKIRIDRKKLDETQAQSTARFLQQERSKLMAKKQKKSLAPLHQQSALSSEDDEVKIEGANCDNHKTTTPPTTTAYSPSSQTKQPDVVSISDSETAMVSKTSPETKRQLTISQELEECRKERDMLDDRLIKLHTRIAELDALQRSQAEIQNGLEELSKRYGVPPQDLAKMLLSKTPQ